MKIEILVFTVFEFLFRWTEYVEKIKTRVIVGASAWGPTTHPREILDEMGNFLGEPKILQKCYSDSSDDEYDDFDENSLHVGPNPNNSLMGRMVGAISRWNSPHSHSSWRLATASAALSVNANYFGTAVSKAKSVLAASKD